MARWQLFGSLALLPSDFVNKLQEAVFGQRANGPSNTSSAALDTNSPLFNQRRVEFSAEQGAVDKSFPEVLDSSIDWVDRQITIRWKFDYQIDVRPGKPNDWRQAEQIGTQTIYLVPTGHYYPISEAWGLFISSGDPQLYFYKQAGFLSVEIDSGTKLKER